MKKILKEIYEDMELTIGNSTFELGGFVISLFIALGFIFLFLI